ncbi:trypsin-like peptidase domain-containing protein [bacterium]|nr:trypsin-like peptidase domain-containing protein [bacterium]
MRLIFNVSRAVAFIAAASVGFGLVTPSRVVADPPMAPVLSARETPTVLAIRRASPAVVNLHGQKTVRTTAAGMAGATGPATFKHVNGMGTGVIIDPRGYVITNYHVVEDVEEIHVTLDNGEEVSAELIAARVKSDLALVKINNVDSLPTIPRGTSSDLMVGESVIAIGNAFGYVHTSTQGIISALHRDVPVNETQEYLDLIQISAGINPGNSGGPLLNIEGEIIGINVAVRVGAQQIAFAIPIDQVVATVTEMVEQHNDSRLITGVRTDGGPREGDGVTIVDVSASSPANGNGLKPGDRVVRVGSQPIDDRLDYVLALLEIRPGDPLDWEVDREGERLEVALQFDSSLDRSALVERTAWDVIGIRTNKVTDANMRRLNYRMRTKYQGGLYVSEVRRGSPADKQGILKGDVLLGIHGWQTTSLTDLAGILEHPDMQEGPRAKFYLVRREQTLFGHLELAAQAQALRR